jgi:chemotaxis family two-component system response regulator Rcp1
VPIEILLVEDNPGDALLTEEALKEGKVKHHLTVIQDGEEALHYLDTWKVSGKRPDIVLLDVLLPKVDGVEILRHIRGDPDLRKIPVIVMTGSRDDPIRDEIKTLHANAFMTKPVDIDQFLEAVKSIKDFWLPFVRPKS